MKARNFTAKIGKLLKPEDDVTVVVDNREYIISNVSVSAGKIILVADLPEETAEAPVDSSEKEEEESKKFLEDLPLSDLDKDIDNVIE